MADIKISDLPTLGSSPSNTDLFEVSEDLGGGNYMGSLLCILYNMLTHCWQVNTAVDC